jgi:hypothetical protein
MAKLVNLTTHLVRIKGPNGVVTIPPSGMSARVKTEQRVCARMDIEGAGLVDCIEDFEVGTLSVPPPESGVIYIVSRYFQDYAHDMMPERRDFVAPLSDGTAVREDGQVVAVTRLRYLPQEVPVISARPQSAADPFDE